MERAQAWLKRYGRPLEMALWDFHFAGGSKENVIRYLSAFQNEDGGFGHGLEPDFWLPKSSPMASWMAGQILVEIKADLSDKIVERLIQYLMTCEQVLPGMWPTVLPENNDYPHAPWWHWSEEAQTTWMFNPSVELAAFLVYWSPPYSREAALGWQSLVPAVKYIMQVDGVDWHELRNFWQCLKLLRHHEGRFTAQFGYTFSEVESRLKGLILETVDGEPVGWAGAYKPLPLEFVKDASDPLYSELKPLVEENLRFFLSSRDKWGIWGITWGWADYPSEFAIASRYWQGIRAVERYKTLRAFGRV
jgi:hypothetical protein